MFDNFLIMIEIGYFLNIYTEFFFKFKYLIIWEMKTL